MWFFQHAWRFLFEIPPFEELLDSKCSTLREELGRPTLRVLGGLPVFFFSSTDVLGVDRDSTDYRQASKTATNKTPDTLGVEESSSPRRVLHF